MINPMIIASFIIPEIMFGFKVRQGWVLKRVLAAVANMGPTALMEVLPTGLIFRVTNPAHDMSTILRLNTTAFQQFSCEGAHVLSLNLVRFSSIINSATDDENIAICGFDESSPNVVSFVFVNQNSEDSRNVGIEVEQVELEHWSAGDEAIHEFKVCIKSEDFAHIMEYSKLNKEAIHIIMMATMVTLNSGYEILNLRKEYEECIIENVPIGTRHHLELYINRLDSFLLASLLTSAVWIHDSHSRSHAGPFLEFPLTSGFGKLLIFLPQPFVIS
ncbi:hypothetical protein Cgig2_026335 [Carnegiea gigantea]|uniref:Proliferating cell nuclear antigen PCNA N-terminal domain-containing protein n=1 Tax=Carnegiea gigantea TaxID=171969 RepID=A0A9Q1KEP3_9CARY|nr:hypothetical protein Cgig2_026335 [Carnegiea gigantea]